MVVFGALAQLLEKQQLEKSKDNGKLELKRLYEISIAVLLDLYH
jgi:hypothetical protein